MITLTLENLKAEYQTFITSGSLADGEKSLAAYLVSKGVKTENVFVTVDKTTEPNDLVKNLYAAMQGTYTLANINKLDFSSVTSAYNSFLGSTKDSSDAFNLFLIAYNLPTEHSEDLHTLVNYPTHVLNLGHDIDIYKKHPVLWSALKKLGIPAGTGFVGLLAAISSVVFFNKVPGVVNGIMNTLNIPLMSTASGLWSTYGLTTLGLTTLTTVAVIGLKNLGTTLYYRLTKGTAKSIQKDLDVEDNVDKIKFVKWLKKLEARNERILTWNDQPPKTIFHRFCRWVYTKAQRNALHHVKKVTVDLSKKVYDIEHSGMEDESKSKYTNPLKSVLERIHKFIVKDVENSKQFAMLTDHDTDGHIDIHVIKNGDIYATIEHCLKKINKGVKLKKGLFHNDIKGAFDSETKIELAEEILARDGLKTLEEIAGIKPKTELAAEEVARVRAEAIDKVKDSIKDPDVLKEFEELIKDESISPEEALRQAEEKVAEAKKAAEEKAKAERIAKIEEIKKSITDKNVLAKFEEILTKDPAVDLDKALEEANRIVAEEKAKAERIAKIEEIKKSITDEDVLAKFEEIIKDESISPENALKLAEEEIAKSRVDVKALKAVLDDYHFADAYKAEIIKDIDNGTLLTAKAVTDRARQVVETLSTLRGLIYGAEISSEKKKEINEKLNKGEIKTQKEVEELIEKAKEIEKAEEKAKAERIAKIEEMKKSITDKDVLAKFEEILAKDPAVDLDKALEEANRIVAEEKKAEEKAKAEKIAKLKKYLDDKSDLSKDIKDKIRPLIEDGSITSESGIDKAIEKLLPKKDLKSELKDYVKKITLTEDQKTLIFAQIDLLEITKTTEIDVIVSCIAYVEGSDLPKDVKNDLIARIIKREAGFKLLNNVKKKVDTLVNTNKLIEIVNKTDLSVAVKTSIIELITKLEIKTEEQLNIKIREELIVVINSLKVTVEIKNQLIADVKAGKIKSKKDITSKKNEYSKKKPKVAPEYPEIIQKIIDAKASASSDSDIEITAERRDKLVIKVRSTYVGIGSKYIYTGNTIEEEELKEIEEALKSQGIKL